MKLTQNENTTDRIIRLVLALAFGVISYMWLSGTLQIIGYILTVVMLITSLTGFCGLYMLFGINTCKIQK